jgi:hypothetical protein
MNERPLTTPDAIQLLRTLGVRGTDADLARVARACARMEPILRHTAEVLSAVEMHASRFFEDSVQLELVRRLIEVSKFDLPRIYYIGHADEDHVISNFAMHGLRRGDYQRGLELLRLYQTPELLIDGSRHESLNTPAFENDKGLFALELGNLAEAESIFRRLGYEPLSDYYEDDEYYLVIYKFAARQNLADALVLKGDVLAAEYISDYMIRRYESNVVSDASGQHNSWPYGYLRAPIHRFGEVSGSNPYARRAYIRTLRGDIEEALRDFEAAEQFQHKMTETWRRSIGPYYDALAFFPDNRERITQVLEQMDKEREQPRPLPALTGQAALLYGTLLTRLGKLRSALKVVDYNRRWAQHYLFRPMTARAHVYQSDVHRLMRDYDQAARMLELPLTWAPESGHKEIYTLALIAKARLHLAQNLLDDAHTAAEEAHTLAETHGFVLLRIDSLITRGHIAYQNNELDEAHALADTALSLAHPIDCGYAWGHAAALHLMGMTHHIRRDEIEQYNRTHAEPAYRMLQGAAEIRQRIQDPRLPNTLELLADLPAPTEEH